MKVLLLLFFLCTTASAQNISFQWHGHMLTPTFDLDGRNTRFQEHSVLQSGVRLGLEADSNLRLGAGYYWIGSHLYVPHNFEGRMADVRYKANYLAGYGEYVIYRNNKWEIAPTLMLDLGITRYRYFSTTFDRGLIFGLEPGISGSYRIWRWIGLSGALGYRQMLLPSAFDTKGASGPYVSFNVKLFLDDLLKDAITVLSASL